MSVSGFVWVCVIVCIGIQQWHCMYAQFIKIASSYVLLLLLLCTLMLLVIHCLTQTYSFIARHMLC